MDRADILTIVHTEIPPAASAFADAIFENLTRQIAEQAEERVEDFIVGQNEELESLARDLIQPAFAHEVHRALAQRFARSASGWEQVFWTNLEGRYNETGAT